MRNHKLFNLFVCTFVFLLAGFEISLAQTASITISPASIDAKVKRGASYTQNFVITNKTGEKLSFHCTFNDFWYDEQNNRLTGRAGTLPRSASLWMQFTPSEIIVEPNSSATVKAVITVPQTATGGYYAVPVFEGMPANKTEAETTKTSTATASIGIRFRGLMMFTTEDGAEYNVEVMNGNISPPTASSELKINLDLRNRGTAHAFVRGAFAILNSSGVLIGRGSFNEKRYLPTQRDFMKGNWAGELPPGNYTCVVTLSYNRVGLEPVSLVYEMPFKVEK